jgi:hypothetical protein
MKTRLATSLIALSTAFATPSFADVTAADVWSNQQALYSAMGITLSGELSGDQMTGVEMNVVLPQGIASMQVTADPFTMTENGDGSVTISYPSPMTITVAGGAQGEGSFSADLTMTHGGYTVIATGDAGDITYTGGGGNLRFDFANLAIDGAGAENMSGEGFVAVDSWTGSAQVTEGDVITYSGSSEVGNTTSEFAFVIDNVTSSNTSTAGPIESTIQATLPAGGSDLMNLSQALRDGLSFAAQTSGAGSTSDAVTTVDGEVMNSQTTQTGAQTLELALDTDGLRASGDAADFNMVFFEPLIFPTELEAAIAELSVAYDIPLNAAEDPQDFRVATSMNGLTLGDTIWNLFDPAAQLPRDPADISFDVTGTGTNGIDLLDFAAMSQLMGPPPIEVDEVTIENLRIAALGAEATAQGSMTFDWTDFQTIPGIARPEGQVTVNLNGANQLMDTLVAMGLIPEEDLMMPRMMMGMFATPVGDDRLETVLEINEQGHILANGQRLQ